MGNMIQNKSKIKSQNSQKLVTTTTISATSQPPKGDRKNQL
jgi:hypothetical protein